jgi:hypothetical protein
LRSLFAVRCTLFPRLRHWCNLTAEPPAGRARSRYFTAAWVPAAGETRLQLLLPSFRAFVSTRPSYNGGSSCIDTLRSSWRPRQCCHSRLPSRRTRLSQIGPNGELDGNGGALAFLKVTALTERKTFFTAMARLLPITIKTAPPLKKVLTREEALHELKARGLDPELINHLRRLPFPEEEKSKLDEMYPPIVDLDEDEYAGDKQTEEEK